MWKQKNNDRQRVHANRMENALRPWSARLVPGPVFLSLTPLTAVPFVAGTFDFVRLFPWSRSVTDRGAERLLCHHGRARRCRLFDFFGKFIPPLVHLLLSVRVDDTLENTENNENITPLAIIIPLV